MLGMGADDGAILYIYHIYIYIYLTYIVMSGFLFCFFPFFFVVFVSPLEEGRGGMDWFKCIFSRNKLGSTAVFFFSRGID